MNQFPMLAFCSDPRFANHPTGPHHPERPDRIRAIHRAVRAAGLIASPDPFPDFQTDLGSFSGVADSASSVGGVADPALQRPQRGRPQELLELIPTPATESHLRLIHPQSHIDHIKHICSIGGGILDQGDTPVGPQSYVIALLSTGAVLSCCDAVMRHEANRAFAAVR